jgi:ribosomal protein L32E
MRTSNPMSHDGRNVCFLRDILSNKQVRLYRNKWRMDMGDKTWKDVEQVDSIPAFGYRDRVPFKPLKPSGS